MDVEKLIELIQERNGLWDISNKTFHMRHVQRKLWIAVADEMECTVDDVKKKWRNLRDTFRKELQRTLYRRTEDGSRPKVSTWPYYRLMSFLANNFKRSLKKNAEEKKNKEKTKRIVVDDEEVEELTESDFAESVEMVPNSSSRSQLTQSSSNNRHKYDTWLFEEKCLKKRDSACQSEAKPFDGDYHFLLSLLPHLKRVPDGRKLQVQMRLQQVLLEEESSSRRLSSYSHTVGSVSMSSPEFSFQPTDVYEETSGANKDVGEHDTKPDITSSTIMTCVYKRYDD